MNFYERIYYNLFQPAFTEGKLAKTYEDNKLYNGVWAFLIYWHGVYGALLASGLSWLATGFPIPGWVYPCGLLIGMLLLKFVVPSKTQLTQLRKLDYRRSCTEMRRFVEMLATHGLFMASLVVGFGALFWVMSQGQTRT